MLITDLEVIESPFFFSLYVILLFLQLLAISWRFTIFQRI